MHFLWIPDEVDHGYGTFVEAAENLCSRNARPVPRQEDDVKEVLHAASAKDEDNAVRGACPYELPKKGQPHQCN